MSTSHVVMLANSAAFPASLSTLGWRCGGSGVRVVCGGVARILGACGRFWGVNFDLLGFQY
jgi:hypothetical protein